VEDPQPQGLHLRNQKTCPNKRGHLWLHYRSLGIDVKDGISWFWIGTHAEYDKIVD
jgi:hypothetical protein